MQQKKLQDSLNSRDIYSKFLLLASDPDQQTRKHAHKAIIIAGKSHPGFLIQGIIEKLQPKSSSFSPESYSIHITLLQEFISENSSVITSGHLQEIYKYLSKVIEIMTKIPVENQPLFNIYKENEDNLLGLMEELAKINDEMQLTFTLRFIEAGSVPHILIIIMLLQLNKFQPNVISNNIVDIITKFIPILASVKTDDLKKEICNLLVQVLETFIMNQENSELYQNTHAVLTQLMSSVHEVLYNNWLNSKEPKLKYLSFKLLGLVIELIPNKKANDIQERVIQLFLDTIKKENSPEVLRVLEGFNRALERFINLNKSAVASLVKTILVTLHQLFMKPILSPNSLGAQTQIKLRNEIYKTIQVLGNYFTSDVFDYYLNRLDPKRLDEATPSLWILRHLIGRCHNMIGDHFIKLFCSQLKTLGDVTDYELRFAYIEVILALVMNNLLTREEDQSHFLQYLLKQVAVHPQEIIDSKNAKSEGYETNLEAVNQRACQILFLLANEKIGISFIWPHIISYLTQPAFSPGMATILKNINVLFNKNHEETPKFQQSWQTAKNLPKPENLLIRMIILCTVPFIFKDLGYEILNALPVFFKALDKDFNAPKTTELAQILKPGKFTDAKAYFEKFEEYVISLFNSLPNQEWYSKLNEAIMESYLAYQSNADFTNTLCRMHGMILSKIERRDVLKIGLDRLFCICHPEYNKNVINGNLAPATTNEEARQNVTKGLGLAAQSNFEGVLDFLKEVHSAEVIPKKQGGLTSFFSSGGGESLKENVKVTCIHTIGYISIYGNAESFMKKFEGSILPPILTTLESAKSKQLKLACYKALSEVSRALANIYTGGSKLEEDFKLYVCKQREKIIPKIEMTLAQEGESSELYLYCYLTLAYLGRLDPPMHYDFYYNIFSEILIETPIAPETLYDSLFPGLEAIIYSLLLRDDIKLIQDGSISILSFWELFNKVTVEIHNFLEKVVDDEYRLLLQRIFLEMLTKGLSHKKLLAPKKDVLSYFVRDITEIVGYLSSEHPDVVTMGNTCISKFINSLGTYDIKEKSKTEIYKAIIQALQDNFDQKHVLPLLSNSLVEAISNRKKELFTGLNDFFAFLHEESSIDLKTSYPNLLESFFNMIDSLDREDKDLTPKEIAMDNELVGNIHKLMKKDLHEILNILLKRRAEFPLARCVSKCLQKVIQDKTMLAKIFNYLTDIINNPEQVIYSDVNTMMFNATLFMGVMMEPREEILTNLTKKFFYQLLGTYLLRFGTAFESRFNSGENIEKDAIKFALWSFQSFLKCADDKPILDALEGYGLQKRLVSELDEGINELILIIYKNTRFNKAKVLLDFLNPFLAKKVMSHKEVVIIVIAQTIFSCIHLQEFTLDDSEFFTDFKVFQDWLLSLIDILIDSIESKSEIIRKYCYRGLGNVSYLLSLNDNPKLHEKGVTLESFGLELMKRSSKIIKIFLRGLDDPSKVCIKEAMAGLQRMTDILSCADIVEACSDICHKLRQSFESTEPSIRMSSINLSAIVFKTIMAKSPESKSVIHEEIHHNLVSILLHLYDENSAVRQACIRNLQETAGILSIPGFAYEFVICLRFRDILEEKTGSEDGLLDPIENHLVKYTELIYANFESKVGHYIFGSVEFVKSKEDNIKGMAIFFLLVLLNKLDYTSSNITIPEVDALIMNCFSDKSQVVRQKVAKGYGILTKVHKCFKE